MPGVSRSGITITAGRFLGLDRDSAARLSFLLLVPITVGAVLFKGLTDVVLGDLPPGWEGPFLVGTLAAALSGFLAIAVLLNYVRRHTYTVFVVYRLFAAAVIVLLIVVGGPRSRLLSGRPVPLVVAGAVCIAFSGILVRLADVQPSTAAFYRCALALPPLAALAFWERRRYGSRGTRLRTLAWVAGAFFAADLILWHHSIAKVGAGLATVLGNVQVVLVPLTAWLLLRERPTRQVLVAVPVVLIGVVLISGVLGEGAYGDDPTLGAVFGILTAIAYAGFLLVLRAGSNDARRSSGALFHATLAVGDRDRPGRAAPRRARLRDVVGGRRLAARPRADVAGARLAAHHRRAAAGARVAQLRRAHAPAGDGSRARDAPGRRGPVRGAAPRDPRRRRRHRPRDGGRAAAARARA